MANTNNYPYNTQQPREPSSTGHQSSNPYSSQQQNLGQHHSSLQAMQGHPYTQMQGQPAYAHGISPASGEAQRALPFSDAQTHGGYALPPGAIHGHPPPAQIPQGYPAVDPRYPASQYPPQSQHGVPQDSRHRHFIPTPSQAAQSYMPGYTESSSRSSRQNVHPSSSDSRSSLYPISPAMQPHSSYAATQQTAQSLGHSSNPGGLTASPSPTTDRIPCRACDKTFGRAHDMRRHYETTHDPAPPHHTCQYCGKLFGRGDSLKRHLANGCDEMPPKPDRSH